MLVVYARRGIAFVRESAAGPIGTGMLLGMLGIAIAWLVRIPFRVVAHWWNRRYDQTDLGYLDWLVEDWVVLAAGFVSLCIALLVVMGLARWLGEWWWLPGAGVFVGIAALFSFTFPYLDFGTTKPLEEPALVAAADTYERELRLPEISLRVEEVSDYTDLANAYAVGFGPSRRVVFWDTLLMEPFTEAQQKSILGHELAHHAVPRIVGVAVRARRRQPQGVLEMLLRCRALVGGIFGNGEIDQQHGILWRELLGAMKTIESAGEIAFGHQRVAIVHQPASVARALDHDIVPKRFLAFPNLVPLERSVAVRA